MGQHEPREDGRTGDSLQAGSLIGCYSRMCSHSTIMHGCDSCNWCMDVIVGVECTGTNELTNIHSCWFQVCCFIQTQAWDQSVVLVWLIYSCMFSRFPMFYLCIFGFIKITQPSPLNLLKRNFIASGKARKLK